MGGLDEIYFKFYETRVPNPASGVRVPVAHRGGRSADLRALGRESDSQAVPRVLGVFLERPPFPWEVCVDLEKVL